MSKESSLRELRRRDSDLISELTSRARPQATKTAFRNAEVARILRGRDPYKEFVELERTARKRGCFTIRIQRRRWLDTDGRRYTCTLARAATTDMWPMGTHYWVRDNAIIGARYLFGGRPAQQRIGKQLLLSALTFMSSVSQLARFRRIISARSPAFLSDANNWPFIFAEVATNLSASKPERWAHQQDAWQILAWYVLDGLERGMIALHELTDSHRAFFGLIAPFLARVSFWRCENSGSWEEIAAVRSSVRSWDHRLIVRLGELSRRREFSFLNRDFRVYRSQLGARYAQLDLRGAVAVMDRAATRQMLRDLPFEAPSYPRTDIRYREADAALIYLLQIEYIEFLALRSGKGERWRQAMERKLLNLLSRLDDPLTGGIARYQEDVYQRSGYFRNVTVKKLKDLFGAPSGDASRNFAGRGEIVPKGRTAMWTHFVWQLAVWSGRRSLEDPDPRFRMLHELYFARGLALITGSDEVSLDLDKQGQVRLTDIPAWRMPECYISDRSSAGRVVVFPSPHTPLNWSVAEMEEAFRVRRRVLSDSVGL